MAGKTFIFSKRGFNPAVRNIILLSILFLCFCVLTGCQSAKAVKPLSPADILPDTDDMYLKIPVKENPDICKTIISNFIVTFTQENCQDFVKHSDVIYASMNFTDRTINAIISGDFPFFTTMMFTSRNGWKTETFKYGGKKYKYYVNTEGFQVSLLSDSVMFISSDDVTEMLKRQIVYDGSAVDMAELLIKPSDDIIPQKEQVFRDEMETIGFYTSKAGVFIENMLGNEITLAADEAYGIFSRAEDYSGYSLDIEMSFVNKHAVKPALFLFKKAAQSGSFTSETISESAIKCTGMNMDIQTMFLLIIGG